VRFGARRLGALALVVAAALGVGACGSSHAAAKPGFKSSPRQSLPIPQPVTSDDWKPPSTAGSPSTGTFCRLMVANYKHVQDSAIATTSKVKAQIVEDFVHFTPTVVAAAPPDISGAAHTYLGGIANVLQILATHDFDAAKAPPGAIGNIIFDPQVTAAEGQLRTWALQHCNYDITSEGI
jgi:hypothetical protein